MSKVYMIGDHTFTQRDDGLYMCDRQFTLTEEDCRRWMLDEQNADCILITREESGLHIPMAVYDPHEAAHSVYEDYVKGIRNNISCCVMLANILPENFEGFHL